MFMPSICLTKDQVHFLTGFKHIFTQVESLTNVPWQMLAGIWTRESFSVASPRTPGGPMQFDPPLTKEEIRDLITMHAIIDPDKITEYATEGINDFFTAILCAACFLKKKINAEKIETEDQIKEAIWLYNGKVGQKPEDSAYVYNGFDKDHFKMHLKGTIPGPKGKRVKIDIQDTRPGAFTVYTQLKVLAV